MKRSKAMLKEIRRNDDKNKRRRKRTCVTLVQLIFDVLMCYFSLMWRLNPLTGGLERGQRADKA